MLLLRPVSFFLRTFLRRWHSCFSCCASCGEIRTPLGHRLCTSLLPCFSIDAVFFHDAATEARPDGRMRQWAARLPWLRSLFVISGNELAAEDAPAGARRIFPETVIKAALEANEPRAREFPLESLLHYLPELAGHYIVFADPPPPPVEKPVPLDFYTPNGIPLLGSGVLSPPLQNIAESDMPESALKEFLTGTCRQAPVRSPLVYSQTRENSAAFLAFCKELPADDAKGPACAQSYREILEQWLYSTGRGIPVPRASLV